MSNAYQILLGILQVFQGNPGNLFPPPKGMSNEDNLLYEIYKNLVSGSGGGGGTVTSVFGRTGAVVAAVNDYLASQIDNDSGVTGADVASALNTLNAALAGKLDASLKGAANGLAELDASGKLPASQLTVSAMEYQGMWNASTNTPALADGAGSTGDVYVVSVAGTQDLGSGNITFAAGDWVIYNGTIWEKSTNSNTVSSVFGRVGAVVAQAGDYSIGQITGAGALASLNTVGSSEIDSNAVTTGKIADGNVTLAKIADITSNRILGLAGGGPAAPTELTANQVRNIINVDDGANNYSHPNHSGDVASVGDGSTTIQPNVVSNTKLADMNAHTVKARVGGTSGDPSDLAIATNSFLGRLTGNIQSMSATEATSLLNNFTSLLKGLVPASGGGTTNFLRADGTWAAPAGGGGGGGITHWATFNVGNTDTGSALSGNCYVLKVIPSGDLDATEMECFITSGSVSTVYMGIYDAGGTLLDECSASTGTAGIITGTLSGTVNLTGGTEYWFGILEGTGSPNFGSQGVFNNTVTARSKFISGSPSAMPANLSGFFSTGTGFYIGAKA